MASLDVYTRITDQIIHTIDQGAGDFTLPWHGPAARRKPRNAATGKAYSGINIIGLWAAGVEAGHPTGLWATYRQWQTLGAQVRRGEKGAQVVFWREVEAAREPEDADDNAPPKKRLIGRTSAVFNAAQVEGYTPPAPLVDEPITCLHAAEELVTRTRAAITHGFAHACYRPDTDRIDMPDRAHFVGSATRNPTEAYYGVLLHELAHWTGHPTRLNRDLSGRFGSANYAKEELVAELTAAFLCADLGIESEPRPDHAQYIATWLRVLRDDNRALFTAARAATQAAEFLAPE